MKDKIKRFFIDKKELLIFIAVVIVVFATVITVATLALSDLPVNSENPIVNPDNGSNNGDTNVGEEEEPTPNPVVKKFVMPLTGEYEVVRIFFDTNLSDEELVSAVISNGSYMVESKGVSFSKADNTSFDVQAVYDGTVVSVVSDELEGTTITIEHADSVVSIYSSLTEVKVKQGDVVSCGDVIASASTSFNDVEAGVHVHLQIKVDGSYINPNLVFGKEITEVSSSK